MPQLHPQPHHHDRQSNHTAVVRALPHDRHAERACIGNSIRSPRWHERARAIVEPADFYFTEHQVLFDALDELHDIGPFTPATRPDWDEWTALWPITPPSSAGVRIGALHTLGPHGAPIWALRRLADHATATVEHSARIVRAHADERHEISTLEDRIHHLAMGRR